MLTVLCLLSAEVSCKPVADEKGDGIDLLPQLDRQQPTEKPVPKPAPGDSAKQSV